MIVQVASRQVLVVESSSTCYQSGGLDQTDRLPPPTDPAEPARSSPSATASCTSRPASPEAPERSARPSDATWRWATASAKHGNDLGPPSLTARPTRAYRPKATPP